MNPQQGVRKILPAKKELLASVTVGVLGLGDRAEAA
ncbi:hypothetical protein COLO4_06421 [Corchorus olitorius]|uniref:Uncharacterized protein n=1 Tax=Corchorus olitorius TaxID=93759 RepID=A0A1R3KN14_9ROSI|nr:hypothetical protein COLO4_06421 [Corchorus olitorius]